MYGVCVWWQVVVAVVVVVLERRIGDIPKE